MLSSEEVYTVIPANGFVLWPFINISNGPDRSIKTLVDQKLCYLSIIPNDMHMLIHQLSRACFSTTKEPTDMSYISLLLVNITIGRNIGNKKDMDMFFNMERQHDLKKE